MHKGKIKGILCMYVATLTYSSAEFYEFGQVHVLVNHHKQGIEHFYSFPKLPRALCGGPPSSNPRPW